MLEQYKYVIVDGAMYYVYQLMLTLKLNYYILIIQSSHRSKLWLNKPKAMS